MWVAIIFVMSVCISTYYIKSVVSQASIFLHLKNTKKSWHTSGLGVMIRATNKNK